MADKKVDRSRPDLAINPSQQTASALSEKGTVNVAEVSHDKGKSALVDKFRKREERWRQEQALHDREAATATPPRGERPVDEPAHATSDTASDKSRQGGAQ